MELSLKERIKISIALEEEAKRLGGQVHTFEGDPEFAGPYERAKAELKATMSLIKKFEEVPF